MTKKRLFVFAGAGISVESGVPSFRDPQGLWNQFAVEDYCEYFRFIKNKNNASYRENLFSFYNELRTSLDSKAPNEAHLKIAYWQKKHGPDAVKVVTSNVDGLFEKAGCLNVLHVHGSLSSQECAACRHNWEVTVFEDSRCPRCNSRLTKPSVVFFNEKAPLYPKMFSLFHPKRRNPGDLFLYVGASQEVLPPKTLFKNKKEGKFVLVNTKPHLEDDFFDEKLYGKATEILKSIEF